MYLESDSPINLGTNGSNGDFGGGWAFWIVILLIFGWGRNGFGNDGGGGSLNADLQRGFDTQGINAKLNSIGNGICDSTYALNNSIVTNGYETRSAISALGYELQNCCCTLGNQIQQVNYNMAMNTNAIQQSMCTNTRDILESQRESTNAILGYLTNEKISSLNRELSLAQSQLSQAQQTSNIISAIRPCPTPSYIVPNPFCCYQYSVTTPTTTTPTTPTT